MRRAALKLGDRAVVLGAGGVGQIIIQLLAASGVRVAAVDRLTEKLRLACEMGATAAFDAETETARAGVLEFSDGAGVECVFNCVGTPDSMKLAAALVMRCGRIVVIGEEPGIVRPYVAARFPLDRINAAFDCVRGGALGRVVVVIKE